MLVRPVRPPVVTPRVQPTSLDLPWEEAGGGTGLGTLIAGMTLQLGGSWFDGLDPNPNNIQIATGISSWSPRAGSGAAFTQGTAGKQPTFVRSTGVATWTAASSQALVGANLSTYFSTTGWTALFIANPTSVANDNAVSSYFINDILICDSSSADCAVALRTTGPSMQAAGFVAVANGAEKTGVTTGSWHLLEASYDNANFRARVDAGTTATTALAGPLASIASAAHLGARDFGGSPRYYNGAMKGVLLFPTYVVGDARWPTVRALIASYYGVTA